MAGSDCHGSSAGIDLNLEQELDIIPTRTGVRPPRVGMVARVVGTLQVTDLGKCGKACGTAEQGPATACLALGPTSLLSVKVQPSSVVCGQLSSINHRHGPVESAAVAGSYLLTGTFHIRVTQGKGVWNRQAAVADFDLPRRSIPSGRTPSGRSGRSHARTSASRSSSGWPRTPRPRSAPRNRPYRVVPAPRVRRPPSAAPQYTLWAGVSRSTFRASW
jgi:hypothetical protein